uniref:Uncharacterized protein n=1 Tax=Arundo donax TaxID=35708 RepID=A0A0A9I1V4_ARUDO
MRGMYCRTSLLHCQQGDMISSCHSCMSSEIN